MINNTSEIEIPEWSILKSIIDNNPEFNYDHSDNDSDNERIIKVRQSNEFIYFHRMKKDSSDWIDYENNYKEGVSRGNDSLINVSTTFSNSLTLDNSSRLKVSNAYSLFDSKQIFNDQPLFWENSLSGSGEAVYISNESLTRLNCTTALGDKVIRQTKEYFNYQSGKSFKIAMAGNMYEGKVNVRKRIGVFDENNGIFFEHDGTDLKVVIRSSTSGSPIDTAITQLNWNIDTLNGSGKSGVTLDISKDQIFIFDIQWFGVGQVKAGFNIDGVFYYCHEFIHANNITVPYINTSNLPLRYEIENIGTSNSVSYIDHISVKIEAEDGYNPKGIIRTVSRELDDIKIGRYYKPIISLRLKSIYNRAQIIPLSFKVYNSSNALVHVKLIHGTNLIGASWVSAGDNSIAEYDIDATKFSNGEVKDDMFVVKHGINTTLIQENILKIISNISGESDILSIVAKTTGSSKVYGSLTFKEIY